MSELKVCVQSVRDSMGCYFAGTGYIDGDVAAMASADSAKHCWDLTWEVLSYEQAQRQRPASGQPKPEK